MLISINLWQKNFNIYLLRYLIKIVKTWIVFFILCWKQGTRDNVMCVWISQDSMMRFHHVVFVIFTLLCKNFISFGECCSFLNKIKIYLRIRDEALYYWFSHKFASFFCNSFCWCKIIKQIFYKVARQSFFWKLNLCSK